MVQQVVCVAYQFKLFTVSSTPELCHKTSTETDYYQSFAEPSRSLSLKGEGQDEW